MILATVTRTVLALATLGGETKIKVAKAGLFNKSSILTPALCVTKVVNVNNIILVTLCYAT